MTTEPLRYDKWIEDALRGVVRRALASVAGHGLPGEHHFYITFRTGDDGVRIPAHLRARYPEEMTIVLQHQFEDLQVDRDAFLVTLRFGGRPERLCVPLRAVTAFADPSVNFGLQLKMVKVYGDATDEPAAEPAEGAAMAAAAGQDNDSSEEDNKTGQVIALDAFRKK